MKKLKKYHLFGKKPSYIKLLIKYNTLVVKYESLIDSIKDDLYEKIFMRLYDETEKLAIYERENKMLREENKKLKKLQIKEKKHEL